MPEPRPRQDIEAEHLDYFQKSNDDSMQDKIAPAVPILKLIAQQQAIMLEILLDIRDSTTPPPVKKFSLHTYKSNDEFSNPEPAIEFEDIEEARKYGNALLDNKKIAGYDIYDGSILLQPQARTL